MKNILLLLILFCFMGCEDDSEYVSSITKVQNIQVTRVNEYTSAIDWDTHEDDEVDGYYIYRAFQYDGLYEHRTTRAYEDTMFIDNTAMYDGENFVWSYYKMSAFKNVGEYTIEGIKSGVRYHGDEH